MWRGVVWCGVVWCGVVCVCVCVYVRACVRACVCVRSHFGSRLHWRLCQRRFVVWPLCIASGGGLGALCAPFGSSRGSRWGMAPRGRGLGREPSRRPGSRSPLQRRPSSVGLASLKADQARLLSEWDAFKQQLAKYTPDGRRRAGGRGKQSARSQSLWGCSCGFGRNFAERTQCWACGKAKAALGGGSRPPASMTAAVPPPPPPPVARPPGPQAGSGGLRPAASFAGAPQAPRPAPLPPPALGASGPSGAAPGEAAPFQGPEPPLLATRVATVSSMLATAKAGGEHALAHQLESHLTVLKEQQQAERPFAARLQSAVDKAAVKQAAFTQAAQRTDERRKQLTEAEQQLLAAKAASEEADVALATLRAQLAQPVGPVATLEGLLTACRSLVGDLPADSLGPLEAALAGLQATRRSAELTLPGPAPGSPTVPCEGSSPAESPAHKRSRSTSAAPQRGVGVSGDTPAAGSGDGRANSAGGAAMEDTGDVALPPPLLVVT